MIAMHKYKLCLKKLLVLNKAIVTLLRASAATALCSALPPPQGHTGLS